MGSCGAGPKGAAPGRSAYHTLFSLIKLLSRHKSTEGSFQKIRFQYDLISGDLLKTKGLQPVPQIRIHKTNIFDRRFASQ